MATEVTTRPAHPDDIPAIVALQASAFSPGRFARTAYRIREGMPMLSPFCRVAVDGDRVIASLRLTPVRVGADSGVLLLGPLAVHPDHANRGHGRRLVAEALEAARAAGIVAVLLVGDMAYYGRLGFTVVPRGQLLLPGPVDPARLLIVPLQPDAAAALRGMVAPHRQA